ncbi:hypothetical protein OAT67_06615 [Bacteriovoracaceae bacterium]|nr:hypothetical protein [Bacteriovoracaceae bacterium]|tara:strand:- start:262576 stop:263148 length:573 start_codon:yes stop_codon:yes gene_type:complete
MHVDKFLDHSLKSKSENKDIWGPIKDFRNQGPLNDFDLMVQASLRYHLQKHLISNMQEFISQGLTEEKLHSITEEFDLGPGAIKRYQLLKTLEIFNEFNNLFELENYFNESFGESCSQVYIESLIILDKECVTTLIKKQIKSENESFPQEWTYSIHFQSCWNECFEKYGKHKSILMNAKKWLSSILNKAA